MTAEEFGKLGFPGADDLSVMFAFNQTDHPDYSIQETKSLDPETKDFEAFVQENKEKLVAEFQWKWIILWVEFNCRKWIGRILITNISRLITNM